MASHVATANNPVDCMKVIDSLIKYLESFKQGTTPSTVQFFSKANNAIVRGEGGREIDRRYYGTSIVIDIDGGLEWLNVINRHESDKPEPADIQL